MAVLPYGMPADAIADLYRRSIIIDSLNISNWHSDNVFADLHDGGLTATSATVATWEGFVETADAVAAWYERFRARSAQIRPVRSVADIHAAKEEGRVGIILSFQNATPIENDLRRLELFADLGVRVIQVTYHEQNLLGAGCYEARDAGLTNFGRDAVREMNRLGILADLSHVGPRTTLDVIEHSERPVAITHANCKGYYDVPRNKTDEAVRACAARGGVIGATAITSFLRTGEASTLDDMVEAIDDLVERAGIDHVGFGSDYTQDQPREFWRFISSQQGTKFPSTFTKPDVDYTAMQMYPKGLETPREMPNLATALIRRGYAPDDVAKVLGGNWLRLFGEVWHPDA